MLGHDDLAAEAEEASANWKQLTEQCLRYRQALVNIRQHLEFVGGSMHKHSLAWKIADAAQAPATIGE